jgi:outer membrane protein OmpA-like peptidoglycan-associated protein
MTVSRGSVGVWASLAVMGVCLARTESVSAQVVPYRVGTTFTFATKPVDSDIRPDFERVLTVTAVSPEETRMDDSWSYIERTTGKPRSFIYHRTFSRRETAFARRIWMAEVSGDTAQHRGTSYMMASSTVMRLLRSNGEVGVTLLYYRDVEDAGTLQRVEPAAVPVSILVNGQRYAVPAIHARLTVLGGAPSGPSSYDLWFADDTNHAWLLRSHVMQGGVAGSQDLVRVDWTDAGTQSQLARAMTTSCRAQIYGIHFATGSADVTPESAPTLDEIADLLRREPGWRITIEGHTDSIGGSAYNQSLSDRRAAAVKDTLVARYKIEPGRLTTVGFGLGRPIETNATLAGRARNRRVELTRVCTA